MDNLFRFIIRYHVVIAFFLIEIFALFLLSRTSDYQKSVMLTKADAFKGSVLSLTHDWLNYLSLKEDNDKLVQENSRLLNYVDKLTSADSALYIRVNDSSLVSSYTYTPAKVVSNTINKKDNYLILNVGSKKGIKQDMGVISSEGIVGQVERVSDNYCTVMSVLNTKWEPSSMLKKTGHFAPLTWDGTNPNYATLVLPQHVPVQIGDTIVTSGFSTSFPEGVMVGTINSFELIKGAEYKIKVKLSVDYQSVRFVNVIDLIDKEERQSLNNEIR